MILFFSSQKRPEVAAIPDLPPNPAKYCSHKVAIVNLAKIMSNPGYHPGQFKHFHDPSHPGRKSGKKRLEKRGLIRVFLPNKCSKLERLKDVE